MTSAATDSPAFASALDTAQMPLDKYDAPALLGTQVRRRFHAMAKPVGSACNLDCVYCYYLKHATPHIEPIATSLRNQSPARIRTEPTQ